MKNGSFKMFKTGHCVIVNSVMGWIQDHSCGLTQIGVQKFSESVRAYVFLTLSSQRNSHSLIIDKDGRVLNAHSILFTSFEQLVKSDTGINNEIHKYQDVLQYALSKVEINVGEHVYMLPRTLTVISLSLMLF